MAADTISDSTALLSNDERCWCCLWPWPAKDQTAPPRYQCCQLNGRFRAYKNMIGLCASNILSLGSCIGMISLESSINPESGLGLVATATPYLALIVTGLLPHVILKVLGSKNGVILGYIGYLVFILANYYPHWITLIAGSVIMGLLYNIGVISQYDHASTVARTYYKSLKETQENAVFLYTSFISFSVKISTIFGNLSSSVVLLTTDRAEYDSGKLLSANKICNNTEADQLEDNNITIYYILLTVYVLFNVLAIVAVTLLADRFPIDDDPEICLSKATVKKYLIIPMRGIMETLLNWRILLLAPTFILNGLLVGFINGLFAKASNLIKIIFILPCADV